MKRKLSIYFAVLAVAASFVVPANLAYAESESSADSESVAELSAEWWQWALSIPTPVNPLLDNGANCMVGQHGEFWFLTGAFAGGTVMRTCSVPENVALFFPLINSVTFDTPGVCGQPANQRLSVKELRTTSAALIDGATNLSVEVDGEPIEHSKRVRSKVFYVALPEDNVFDAPCTGANLGNVPAGIYSPSVDDGFYAKVDRLKAGTHTLHFHSENTSQDFVEDVTYTLNVVPVTGGSKERHKREHKDDRQERED